MFQWLKWPKEPVNEVVKRFNAVPLPAPTVEVTACNFLVLDIETTGLVAKKDYIVSIGWVPIRQQQIELNEARHYLISSPVSVGQSAIYHGLHDKDFSQARELPEVLTELLEHYAGYVLVAHHASLERSFLEVACQRCFGRLPRLKFIDTLQIEWQRLLNQGKVVKQQALRLPSCLARHHLPQSQAHHALEDAYSCALLLLCQLKQHREGQLQLQDLYLLSRG